MADTEISGLTAYSAQSGDDLEEIVDVSDTTMAASGTNKKATTKQKFGSPGSGQVIYWNGASPGVPAGAANLTIGSSGQLNFTPIADPASPAQGDLWISTTSGGLVVARAAALVNRLGGTIYRCGQCAAVANTAAMTSLLTSPAWSRGSLTIPANTLDQGNGLAFVPYGTISTASTATTWGWQLLLNSTVVLVGTEITSGPGTNLANAMVTRLEDIRLFFTAVGAAGATTGFGVLMCTSSGTSSKQVYFTNDGAGGGTPVTVDTTVDLTIDLQFQWGAASASNSLQITGFEVYLF